MYGQKSCGLKIVGQMVFGQNDIGRNVIGRNVFGRIVLHPNWAHFAHRPYCTATLNSTCFFFFVCFVLFLFCFLFSIRVKEFEPIVLRQKRRRVIALFKSIFLETDF